MPEQYVTDPPITYIPKIITPDGTYQPIDPPYPGWQEAMRTRTKQQRDELIAQLSHDESGIDVAGVAHYLQTKGMSLNPHCAVTNSGDRMVQQVLSEHDAALGAMNTGPTPTYNSAYFLGRLGLTLLDRPEHVGAHELQVGLAHEGAHANGITEVTVVYDVEGRLVRDYVSRRGFRALANGQWQGALGEESFAVLTEGGYSQVEHAKQNERFAVKPHRMLGFGHIHPKYIHEQNQTHHFVLGAVALEVAAAYDPGLPPIILEARQSQEGIDAMVARLEAISNGLGRRMLNSRSVGLGRLLPDDGSLFLRHALRATRTSTGDVLDICEAGPMSQYFTGTARSAADSPSGTETSPVGVRERIEVQSAPGHDDDELTKLLRAVAETMRDDDNMS